jgi:hypothetical protein
MLIGGGDAGVAQQVAHVATVAESYDSADCATLISDTGSGRVPGSRWRGEGRLSQNRPFLDS